MEIFILLAQEGAALEAADKGLTLIERAQAGGVPLISLIVAVVCGAAFYWQLRRNNKQSEEALEKAEKRERDKDAETKVRLSEQEGFLREMLDRDRESQEAQLAAVQAVQGMTHAIQDLKSAIDGLKRRSDESSSRLKDLDTRIKDIDDSLRRRFRDG